VSPKELLAFLRSELAPTPGRASATLRLTISCLVVSLAVMTHHIPHPLVAFVVIYLITLEDVAAMTLGAVLGILVATAALGFALLALQVCIDLPWLRIGFLAAFLFAGLFLKRALTLGVLGSIVGLPTAMTMMLPDIGPPIPEVFVEFALWIWLCMALGAGVNTLVHLLLSPGDPLVLLGRELDTRLAAVELALQRLAGSAVGAPVASLDTLAVAGMTRMASLLKTSALVHRWAKERHEALSALITLVDRLVTEARALKLMGPIHAGGADRTRLARAADACQRLRRAFEQRRRPRPEEWVALDTHEGSGRAPIVDVERTLDDIALAVPGTTAHPPARPGLFVPDAFENAEYVRFAVKGTLAALICYFCFIGFDYPAIYTSLITCFVVSLTTIGSSNQKGILRFGGAAVGGLMGLIALMYLLPNVESIGGFWLVFGSATAVAAWVNFGSPRISYGGYQVGLAFYKAVLQGFGMAASATVIRDRLIGIFFGLAVFGIVEHLLWPVRAADQLRARFAEMLRLLAELARAGQERTAAEIDGWRLRISQKVEEIQGLIESSKFELESRNLDEMQRAAGDAQVVFLLLLSRGRHHRALELDDALAAALEAVAERVAGDGTSTPTDPRAALTRLGLAAVSDDSPDETYRTLVTSLRRLSTSAPTKTIASDAKGATALAPRFP
jgi:multidrug resistance protein MdtO